MSEPSHPITTAKGNSVLTLILAAVSVFTPFFTSIQGAQLLAAVLALVIVWVFFGEFRAVLRRRAKPITIALPLISLAIIGGVTAFATWAVDSRPKAAPAVTMQDISAAVTNALAGQRASQPPLSPAPVSPAPARDVTYRVVVDEPKRPITPDPTLSPHSPPAIDDHFVASVRRSIARSRIGGEAWRVCIGKQGKLAHDLYGFIGEAVDIQNEYNAGHNDKKMLSGLVAWYDKVEHYFADNKDGLPAVTMFQLANEGQGQHTFLGIHDTGFHAWASMDAKRKVLEAIRDDITKKSCDDARDAAISACSENNTC